jgi:transcriptional regulator with XRE-family HTH domain
MTVKEATYTEETGAKTMSDWLDLICRENHLSLRQAADRSGLSHSTLASIKKGTRPTAATISKLAAAFSNDGPNQRATLEDRLLTLCGYRSSPEVKQSEPLARLVDKLSRFSDGQLIIMENIVDFCATLGDQPWGTNR